MERCFAADATISTSLIAVVPEAGYEIHKIHPSGVASAPTSGFVPAVVCHEFVFVAGQMAHNPGLGLSDSIWPHARTRALKPRKVLPFAIPAQDVIELLSVHPEVRPAATPLRMP
jgi:hypothetical protein